MLIPGTTGPAIPTPATVVASSGPTAVDASAPDATSDGIAAATWTDGNVSVPDTVTTAVSNTDRILYDLGATIASFRTITVRFVGLTSDQLAGEIGLIVGLQDGASSPSSSCWMHVQHDDGSALTTWKRASGNGNWTIAATTATTLVNVSGAGELMITFQILQSRPERADLAWKRTNGTNMLYPSQPNVALTATGNLHLVLGVTRMTGASGAAGLSWDSITYEATAYA